MTDRLMAAYNAFAGKVPAPDATPEPYFHNFTTASLGMPTQNTRINHYQLRAFSETPITRRAIDYIRNQVARLEWDLEARNGKKLTAEQRKQLQVVKDVLMNPNPDDNWMSFIGQIIEDMLVIGQGASEIKAFNGHPERPFIFYPVDAASIQIYMDWDGSPMKPRFAQVDLQNKKTDFKPTEMLLFKHNPRSNTPFGLSPTEVSIMQIQYLLDAQSYAGKTASNATPKKMLWMGQEISEKQLSEFRQYFKDEIEGRSHIPITGGHDKPESIELGHVGDQALYLQWQTFLISVIASAFNLDIMKFNAIVGINRSTGATLDDASDEGAIRPMAHQIEHYINQFVLSLFGLSDVAMFKFRFTTSFQDRKSLAAIHQIYGQMDVFTINEIRREQGYEDLPFDEQLGHSKGDLTISEYRAIFGGNPVLFDSVGVDEDTNTLNPYKEAADSKVQDTKFKQQQQVQSQNNNGGNNGTHGTKNVKNKAFNKNDDSNDITL